MRFLRTVSAVRFFIYGGRKMICKNCGKEIDDVSKFCEHCGAKIKQKKKATKKSIKILGFIVVLIILLTIFLAPACKYYRNDYYNVAAKVKSNMLFNEQFIDSIKVNREDYSIELVFSDNNFDNVIDDSLMFQGYEFSWEINCLAYDPDADNYSFVEYSPEKNQVHEMLPGINYGIIHESFYNNHLDFPKQTTIEYCDTNFKENEIYKFTFTVYLAPKDNYGTLLRKLCYRILSNNYITSFLMDGFTTASYFIYENGEFKAIYPNEVSSEYVNALWNGADLNLIKYDEDGNRYLEGPVKTREIY